MNYPSIFENNTTQLTEARLNKLNANTSPQWGKMNVGQMMRHLNIVYETSLGKFDPKTPALIKFFVKLMAKDTVVGNKPYNKNTPTAKYLVMTANFDFEKEKEAFVNYMKEVEIKGPTFFEGRDSNGFGKLSAKEWSHMIYKHIDHHFNQFGV